MTSLYRQIKDGKVNAQMCEHFSRGCVERCRKEYGIFFAPSSGLRRTASTTTGYCLVFRRLMQKPLMMPGAKASPKLENATQKPLPTAQSTS